MKPPAFGNCTPIDEILAPKINFEDFKNIFSDDGHGRQKHLSDIKQRLDIFLNQEPDCTDIFENLDVDASSCTSTIMSCVIYYLAGFISRKLYKSSQCSTCKENLYFTNPAIQKDNSELTELKSRGFLNHPASCMVDFLSKVEEILVKYIHSVDVFEETVAEVYEKELSFDFSCRQHQPDVISRSLYFYIVMRVKQYYKQEEKSYKRQSAEKRKESRLQSH